jgi:hypothetical protein
MRKRAWRGGGRAVSKHELELEDPLTNYSLFELRPSGLEIEVLKGQCHEMIFYFEGLNILISTFCK